MAGRWSQAAFRLLDFDFDLDSSVRSSIRRWPQFVSSYLAISAQRWLPRSIRWWSHPTQSFPLRWPELDFSIVDDVVWSVITAVESVALVSMLCFFFVFCGCTV